MTTADLVNRARALANAGHYDEVVRLCEPLAQDGNLDCRSLLGWIYLKGNQSVPKDIARAIVWLEPVAKLKHATSAYLLGTAHFESSSYADACHWFEVSGENGYSAGWYQLAKMYRAGMGVSIDISRAKMLFSKAAQLGHIYAQREVALDNYRHAKGLARKVRAGFLFVRAIFMGIGAAVSEPYSEKTFH